jgi:thiol-disulfide isomerase/thioredoxin
MPHDRSALRKYYSEAALPKIEEKSLHWSAEQQAQLAAGMKQLFADAASAVGHDPGSEAGQAIASRWIALAGEFTGGDPEILEGLKRFYAGRPSWPQEYQNHWNQFVRPEVWEFVTRAIEHGLGPVASTGYGSTTRLAEVRWSDTDITIAFAPVTPASFKEKVTEATGLVLVACWAEGCVQCQIVKRILTEVASKYGQCLRIFSLDVAAQMPFAMELRRVSMTLRHSGMEFSEFCCLSFGVC